MATMTEMRVSIDCRGCENMVKKCLEKIKGVDQVEIDMGMQKVTVTGCAEQKKILKAVRRTGRRAELWQYSYNPETLGVLSNQQHNIHSDHGLVAIVSQYAQPRPCSSYNYYKHGYQGDLDHDYQQGYTTNYHHNPSNSSIYNNGYGATSGDVFSDDNPHGCSIM